MIGKKPDSPFDKFADLAKKVVSAPKPTPAKETEAERQKKAKKQGLKPLT